MADFTMATLVNLVVFLAFVSFPGSESTSHRNLHEITKRQASHCLPMDDSNSPVRVDLRLSLLSIADVDKFQKRLSVLVQKQEIWFDPELEWDEEEYGTSSLCLREKDVWIPDTVPYNAVRKEESIGPKEVIVNHNGKLMLYPRLRYTTECDLSGVDTYTGASCRLIIGSFNYDVKHVTLSNPSEETFSIGEFSKISDYEILSHSVVKSTNKYSCCDRPFDVYTFEFTLRLKFGDKTEPASKLERNLIKSVFRGKPW